MQKATTFEDRVRFLFEQRTELYITYNERVVAEEKRAMAQKALQSKQLCWLAGRAGL